LSRYGYGSDDEPLFEATYTVKGMAKPKRGPSTAAVDNHVGGRIRERRIMLKADGVRPTDIARQLGIGRAGVYRILESRPS
jgi:DNA invertase Pin-like site-specific DNA recombinase